MIKAFIFDLDGTLYDERDFVESGFTAVALYVSKKYCLNFNGVYTKLVTDFDNGLRGNNFDVLLNKLGLPSEEVGNLITIYRKHKPNIHLDPDTEAVLRELKSRCLLGLITDGWRETQENKIAALNLRQYIDIVIINSILNKEYKKPSKMSFQMMLRKLGVIASEAVYVGDNPLKDFVGPKELGIHTIRIRRGKGEYDSVELDNKREAEYTVNKLPLIINFLTVYPS